MARLIFINGRLYKFHKYIGSFVYQDITLLPGSNILLPGSNILLTGSNILQTGSNI